MRRWLVVVLGGLFSFGCFTPVEEVQCAKDSDCAPAFFCVQRTCTTTRPDASSSTGGGTGGGGGLATGGGGGTGGFGGGLSDGGTNWGNVANVVMGAAVGQGMSPLSELAHPLTVTATGDRRFQVVNAQLTRSGPNTQTGYLAVRVRHVGTMPACFVKADPLTYLGANGQTVHESIAGTFVYGSSAMVGTSLISTSSCVLPGEEGFFIDIVLDSDVANFFSNTTRVRMQLDASPSAVSVPVGAFRPRSYTAMDSSLPGFSTVTALCVNEGGSAITLDGAHFSPMLIPLDAEGRGLTFSFFDSPTTSAFRVAAGGSVSVVNSGFLFDGASSVIYMRSDDFVSCAGCLRAGAEVSTPAGKAARLALRREAEAEKLRLISR